jgi:hypothetical protein
MEYFQTLKERIQLNESALSFILYKSSFIEANPKVSRREGGSEITLSSQSFCFNSDIVKLAIKIPGLKKEHIIQTNTRQINGKLFDFFFKLKFMNFILRI